MKKDASNRDFSLNNILLRHTLDILIFIGIGHITVEFNKKGLLSQLAKR